MCAHCAQGTQFLVLQQQPVQKCATLHPCKFDSLAGPKDNIWACTPIDIAQAWGGTGRQNCSLEAQTSLEAKWRTRRRHRRVAAVIVGC